MFRKCLVLSLPVLLFLSLVPSAAAKDLVPAGTIIYCILDEPNFSPKTAMIGDPVLCHLGPLRSFGHTVFPRGAQLSGHLQDYRAPGHFFGKGWMALEFDRLILPNAEVMPLSAKIINAPHQKVDAAGNIKGKGHPKRDALLWLVPPLWPIKILTLPARGPYPTFKGETRLAMRLMEDVELPLPTSASNVPAPPWVKPSSTSSYRSSSSYQAASDRPQLVPRATYMKPVESQPVTTTPSEPVTIIALQAGAAVLARDYWVDGTNLHCVAQDGAQRDVPLAALDLAQTVRLNQDRNIDFSLHSRGAVEQ